MASHTYKLRSGKSKNYKELANVNLPRFARITQGRKLYPIEVVERAGPRVKIHYIGYDDSSDEWRELSDIVTSHRDPVNSHRNRMNSNRCIAQVQLYSLYQELAIKIKQALTCGRKQSPLVKINMGFDCLLFRGGLQTAGTPTRCVQESQRYKVEHFSDLDSLLGHNWHYRGINPHGDYAYIVLDSIEFYLHK